MALKTPELQQLLRAARPSPAALTHTQRAGLSCDTDLDFEFTTTCAVGNLTPELLLASRVRMLHVTVLGIDVEALFSVDGTGTTFTSSCRFRTRLRS